ncbi:hypothetical protein [Streptomyces botrytidirepellens]|uniref:Secreted protein n=1 Tax=Streptomyces botrytidirepellens TaxID=2486417 RepID=A0A3M8VXS5_9ACTN|nr:hypothetical protein [Streptomyces botrytidirepellens]RNG22526.1 hypothetical protein EEJ42_20125 [Streptomyces botrytidirepellens]
MEAIWILLLLFVLFIVSGAYVTVRVVRTAKRSLDRTVDQARRTVEDTRLRARQFSRPGAAGELAELRLSLRTSMSATEQALHAVAGQDRSVAESLNLFQRLGAHGRELDDDLKRLEREPDKTRLAALLPELRERTERITHSADSLRWAVRERAQRFAHDELDALGREIEMEAGALRHWTVEEPRAASGPRAASEPASGPRAASEPGSVPGSSPGEPAPHQQEQPSPPSLEPTPRPQPHSWQKPWQESSRPENTA